MSLFLFVYSKLPFAIKLHTAGSTYTCICVRLHDFHIKPIPANQKTRSDYIYTVQCIIIFFMHIIIQIMNVYECNGKNVFMR
jgi:hypothetical protein